MTMLLSVGGSQGGCPREPEGISEAESRARGNNAGPPGRAPGARLLYGLSGAKHRRRLRATTPDFHPPGRRRSDIDDSYALSRAWMTFRWPDFSGVVVSSK